MSRRILFGGVYGLVLYEIEALVAIEPKTGVARQQRDVLSNGVRNDDVVAGV